MTVSSTTDRAIFSGNGITVIFPLPFRFFSNSDIQASLINDLTGAITPQNIGTHFTLIGAGLPEQDGVAESALTMLTAPAVGSSLFVQRVIPFTQPTDIVNQGRFFPEIHETVFDRVTMLAQQNSEQLARAIRVNNYDPVPDSLPGVVARAGKLMGFDSFGNPIAADLSAVDSDVFSFNQSLTGGFSPFGVPTPRIHKMADRLFVGGGVEASGGSSGGQSWLATMPQPGLGWLERASWLYVCNSKNTKSGAIAITGAATNERAGAMAGDIAIGMVGQTYNNNAAAGGCWALYLDAKSSASTASATWGVEIAVCNLGAYVAPDDSSSQRKTFGLTLQAGADSSVNGFTDSCTLGIGFGSTGATWGVGITFGAGCMRPHTDALGTYYKNMVMRTGMQIGWEDSAGNATPHGSIRNTVTAAVNATSLTLDNGSVSIRDNALDSIARFAKGSTSANRLLFSSASANPSIAVEGLSTNSGMSISTKGTGVLTLNVGSNVGIQISPSGASFGGVVAGIGEVFRISNNANSVNFINASGTISGGGVVQLTAQGTDTNLDFVLVPKGAGALRFGTWTTNADAPINGYITIKDAAGNTRKLATIA